MSTYTIGVTGLPTARKTPDADLDYTFNWSKWLAAIDETIVTFSVEGAAGLTLGTPTQDTPGYITVFASGGTVGVEYPVTCYIETATRKDNRSIVIKIVPKR